MGWVCCSLLAWIFTTGERHIDPFRIAMPATICGVYPVYTPLWIRLVFLQRSLKSNPESSKSLLFRRSLIPNFIISKKCTTFSDFYTEKNRIRHESLCINQALKNFMYSHTSIQTLLEASRLSTLIESSPTHPTQMMWCYKEKKVQAEAFIHEMRWLWEKYDTCILAE